MSNIDKTLATAYLKNKVNRLSLTKNPRSGKSLIKSVIKKAFDQRVMGLADTLFNAQASLAVGVSYLMRIDKYEVKKANGEIEYRKKPAVVVTDKMEIVNYVDYIGHGGSYYEDDECEYYYITTQKPDNQALDSMLNRTFGRAKESMEIDVDVKVSLRDLAKERLKLIRDIEENPPSNAQNYALEHVIDVITTDITQDDGHAPSDLLERPVEIDLDEITTNTQSHE